MILFILKHIRSIFLFILFSFFISHGFSQKEKSEFEVLQQETKEYEYTAHFIEASKQKMLGNFTESISLYLKCLDINSESTVSMFEIARILYINNDFAGALKLMERAVQIEKTNTWYYVFIVDLYKQCKQYDKAVDAVNKILALDKYNELLYYEKINLLLLSGKVKKAEKEFSVIEQNFSDSPYFIEQKINFLYNINKIGDAEKLLIKLINDDPSNSNYISVLANLYFNINKLPQALQQYNKLLSVSEDTAVVHLYKAEIYLKLYDTSNFIKEYKYVLVDTSIDVDAKIDIANQFFSDSSDFTKKYEKEFSELLYISDTTNIKARMYYVNYLLRNDKLKEAVPHLYNILENDKSNLSIYSQLLYIENSQQNWDTVFLFSQKALDFYPNQYFLFFYNGFSALMLEKYNDAINSFMNGVNFCPTNTIKSQFYLHIAEAYYKLNNFKMSFYFFDKALSLDENNVVVLNNYSYYLSLQNQNLDKALLMTKKCNEIEPNSAVYLDTYAWVLFKLEKYSESKDIIEKAITLLNESNGEILEHYGDILFKMGKIDEALIQWKDAVGKEGASQQLPKKIINKQINITVDEN